MSRQRGHPVRVHVTFAWDYDAFPARVDAEQLDAIDPEFRRELQAWSDRVTAAMWGPHGPDAEGWDGPGAAVIAALDGEGRALAQRLHEMHGWEIEYVPIEADPATYAYTSAQELFGRDGEALVSRFVDAMVSRSGVHPDHASDVAARLVVEFAVVPERTMHIAYDRTETWITAWDGSVPDAQRWLNDELSDLAGYIKEDRNRRFGGHHPWDDPATR